MKRRHKTPFWSLIHPDQNVESFIFGTMHLGSKEAYTFLDLVVQRMSQIDQFYAETSLDDLSSLDASFQLIPNGQSLVDLLGEKKYQKIRKILLKTFKVDIHQMRYTLPFLVSNQLVQAHLFQHHPTSADMYLWNKAGELNIPRFGLEHIKEQLEIMRQIPMDIQIKQLKSLAKSPHKMKKSIDNLIALYAKGDIHGLFKSSKKSMGKLRTTLIYDRNKVMVDRIVTLSHRKSIFSFGAGHLSGKFGVLHLLKERGYILKPTS